MVGEPLKRICSLFGVVGMRGPSISRLVTVLTELSWVQTLCLQHIAHSMKELYTIFR